MNNNIITWAVIALAVLGGAWYFTTNSQGGAGTMPSVATTTSVASTPTPQTATKPAQTPIQTHTAPKTVQTAAKTAGVGPLTFLLGLKQSLVCTVKTMSGPAHSGTLYVNAAGQARADFSSSSMIDDGSYLYAWAKGATTGLKLLAASSASGSAMAYNGGIDLLTNLSYACNPWTADASIFVPPSSVSF